MRTRVTHDGKVIAYTDARSIEIDCAEKKMATDLLIETAPDLEEKTVTANGEYTPSEGKDGFSKFEVKIPTGYGSAAYSGSYDDPTSQKTLIKYGDEVVRSLDPGKEAQLVCKNRLMEDDFYITAPPKDAFCKHEYYDGAVTIE